MVSPDNSIDESSITIASKWGGLFVRHWRSDRRKAPTILLIHGLGASSRYMIPLGSKLQHKFDVYAVDLPGFGRSSRPDWTLSLDELAESLYFLITTLGLTRLQLLGNSLGCQVIMRLLYKHPGIADRAVLIGPTMDPSAAAIAQAGRLLLDAIYEPVQLWIIMIQEYFKAGIKRDIQTFKYGLQDNVCRIAKEIQTPILLVRGEKDVIVSSAWIEELQRTFPKATLIRLPGLPHSLHFMAPDKLLPILNSD